jgi:hypothetical protein
MTLVDSDVRNRILYMAAHGPTTLGVVREFVVAERPDATLAERLALAERLITQLLSADLVHLARRASEGGELIEIDHSQTNGVVDDAVSWINIDGPDAVVVLSTFAGDQIAGVRRIH